MYMYIFSLYILVVHIKNMILFFVIIDLNSEKMMYTEKKKKIDSLRILCCPNDLLSTRVTFDRTSQKI